MTKVVRDDRSNRSRHAFLLFCPPLLSSRSLPPSLIFHVDSSAGWKETKSCNYDDDWRTAAGRSIPSERSVSGAHSFRLCRSSGRNGFSPSLSARDDIFHDKKATFACLAVASSSVQFIAPNSGVSPPLPIFTSLLLVLTESTLVRGPSSEKILI